MKKKIIKYGIIIVLIIIVLIGIISIVNSKKTTEENTVLVLEGNINAITEDKYANLTTEQIEQLTSDRSIDKVNLKIKDGTLTKEGATIIITDKNDLPYSYNEYYTLEKLEEKWEKLESNVFNRNDLAYEVDDEGIIEMKINWKEEYGELENGKYRILFQIDPADQNTVINAEFEIK